MAMKIGSKYKFSEVQLRHWEQFAQLAGFSKGLMKKRLLQFATALPESASELQQDESENFSNEAIVADIVEIIEKRCERTIRLINA